MIRVYLLREVNKATAEHCCVLDCAELPLEALYGAHTKGFSAKAREIFNSRKEENGKQKILQNEQSFSPRTISFSTAQHNREYVYAIHNHRFMPRTRKREAEKGFSLCFFVRCSKARLSGT